MSVDYSARIYYGILTDKTSLKEQYDYWGKIYDNLETNHLDTSEAEQALDFLDCYCHVENSYSIDTNVIIGICIAGAGAGASCYLDFFDLKEDAQEEEQWLTTCITKYFPDIHENFGFIMTCMVD